MMPSYYGLFEKNFGNTKFLLFLSRNSATGVSAKTDLFRKPQNTPRHQYQNGQPASHLAYSLLLAGITLTTPLSFSLADPLSLEI